MKLYRGLILLVFTLSLSFAGDAPNDPLSNYQKAIQAYQEKNYSAYLSEMQKAVERLPDHPGLQYHLAKALVLTGKSQEALPILAHVAQSGEGIKIEEEKAFSSLQQNPEFIKIVREFQANREPSGSSKVAFEIPTKDLIPEGITYDPVQNVFYIGSIYRRKIISVDRDGKVSDFTKEKQDGLWGVLGMKVDAKRRLLWAVSSNMEGEMEMVEPDPQNVWHTALFQYDLNTRKLIKKYVVAGNQQNQHGFNDLAISSNGDIFVTDSSSGELYIKAHSGEKLRPLISAGGLFYPNGIALSHDEKKLYVAQLAGIAVFDLSSRKLQKLEDGITGIDGMVQFEGDLVGIQGLHGAERIVRLHLSNDGMKVDRLEVLQKNHPSMKLPTTGVVVDGWFHYIANSQVHSYDEKGKIFPMDQLQSVVILKLPLQRH